MERRAIDVMPVPGAFELPLAAMALAKTRRYACVIALGCVIRGETPHFEYISAEAASGLQLAALETGVPVSFGVLTCETREQAFARSGGASGRQGRRRGLLGARDGRRLRAPPRQRQPLGRPWRAFAGVATLLSDVEGLRNLWQGTRVRTQPKPLHGGYEGASTRNSSASGSS